MSRKTRDYSEMSAVELDRVAAKFDREFISDEAVPLAPAMKAKLRAARRRGRPRVGQGARRVLVTIEAGLLSKVDALVRRKGLTRAQVIARGLRMVLTRNRRVG